MLKGWGMQGGQGIKGENWENCNSTINKIHLRKFPYLVTASTKNGAGGEISKIPSPLPCPSFSTKDGPFPVSPLERIPLC